MIRVGETIAMNDREVEERFVRAMGPSGQNARREATAVELRLDIAASSLPPDVKDRLVALAGRAVTSDGVLVIVGRARRSQPENRVAARARLLALLQRAARAPKQRQPTVLGRTKRAARVATTRRHGAVKQGRSFHADD
jgi:ribosome-associated protein